MKDYYQTLGVTKKSSLDEIKAAYKELAMTHHPDKGGDEEIFKTISVAYDTLKDSQKREQYDLEQQYGAGHPFKRNVRNKDGFVHLDIGDLNNIFNTRFHQAFKKSPDTMVQYPISLEEAFHGKKDRINLEHNKKTLDINIPPGVQTGTRFRLPKMGYQQYQDSEPGDFILDVRIQPHRKFTRYGRDLHIFLDVDVIDCILGVDKKITNIDGKMLKTTIVEGSDPGTKLRLKGQGMPIINHTGRGDLIVEIRAHTPKLSKEQKEILKTVKNTGK